MRYDLWGPGGLDFSPGKLQQARHQLLHHLAREAYLEGEFVLASGAVSSFYLDGRRVTLSPVVALVAYLMLARLQTTAVEALGGLTLGADPIAGAVAALSAWTPRPLRAFIVRKEAKEHGVRGRIAGPPLQPGQPVAVVDDVLTTGGSIHQAIAAVEEAGARVERVLVIIDREQGGADRLAERGYQVEALYRLSEIVAARR